MTEMVGVSKEGEELKKPPENCGGKERESNERGKAITCIPYIRCPADGNYSSDCGFSADWHWIRI